MNNTFSNENLTMLISYPFKDAAWKKKLVVGILVSFVPIFGICLQGYSSHILQRVAREGGEPYLPEWDDWGRLFIDGLRVWGVSLIGMLPVLVLMMPAILLINAAVIIPAVMSDSRGGDISGPLAIIPLLGSFGGILLILAGTLLSLGLALLIPAAVSHVVVKQSFAAVFQYKEWWPVWRANMSGFLLCTLVMIGISLALNIVFQFVSLLVIICCPLYIALVGFLGVYIGLVMFPLYAQVYRDGVNKLAILGEPKG